MPGTSLFSAMSGPMAPMRINYSGPRAGFLDLVAARYGIAWSQENGEVQMFAMQTKTFRLAALPGDTSMESTVGSTSSGGGGSSGGSSSGSAGRRRGRFGWR